MSGFRMYISKKENPSASNSILVIPSWVGGYYASVTENSAHYCTNCTYYILIEADNDFAEVFFTAKYEGSYSPITPQDPVFSTLKPFKKHCYTIDVEEKYKEEEIIIQTVLFSGSAYLLVKPWNKPQNQTDYTITKEINSEDVSILTPAKRNIDNKNTGPVYICLRTYDYTSYMLKVFFASQTENLQKFNFLFSGVTINSYLPKGAVTRHRITDFSVDSDIFFNMKITSGNPKFYGYVCEEARKCFFTKENLEILSILVFLMKSFLYLNFFIFYIVKNLK